MHKDYMKRYMWKWFTQGLVHTRYSVDFVYYHFPFSQVTGRESSFARCLHVCWWRLVPLGYLFHILNIY